MMTWREYLEDVGRAETQAELLPLIEEKDQEIAELKTMLASITAQQYEWFGGA